MKRLLNVHMASIAMAGGLGCSDGQAVVAPSEEPPPIVLLSIDTFRADRVGAYGNPRGLTPNLDAFAAEAVVFEHAYSQAVQTAPSHTSLFTSLYPTEQLGSNGQPFVFDTMPLLAELLSLYDYQTGAFVGGADLSLWRGLNKGFDVYEVPTNFASFYHTGPAALAWLAETQEDRPYFLFVHGYDAHARYLKPPPYGYAYSDARTQSAGQTAARSTAEWIVDGVMYSDFDVLVQSYETELRPRSEVGKANLQARAGHQRMKAVPVEEPDIELIRDVYDGAVSYVDTMIGLFLSRLEAQGVLDEAVVVILADHGEQLGENGLFGHCCNANDEEAHVPLMIRLPGGEGGGRRVSGFVELVDVMPTLLDIARVVPPARMRGRSLTPALHGEPFEGRRYSFTQGNELMRLVSMRGAEGRLTFSGLSASTPMLGDIVEATRLDGPAFSTSQAVTPAERAEMRGHLVDWLRALAPPPAGGAEGAGSGAMPDALRKSLREHGYWNVEK